MPRQAATIGSLSQAFEGVEEMQADGPDRGEGCRPPGRPVPVASGIRHDGRKEIVDFRRESPSLAPGRSRPRPAGGGRIVFIEQGRQFIHDRAAQLLGVNQRDGATVIARDVMADADGQQLYRRHRLNPCDRVAQMPFQIVGSSSV